jgi:hypothetical protein
VTAVDEIGQVAELRPSDCENLAGQDTGRENLSHSSLSTQLACLQKYEYERVQRLELVEGPRALGLGKAFQKAIELQDPAAGERALFEAAPQFRTDDEETRLRVEQVTVGAAAALYLRKWPGGAGEQREFEYRVRLRSPWTGAYSRTFDLVGYADGVIDCGGYLELIENKFVGQITGLTLRKLKLDRQVSLACYGLWRATGKPVRAVHYRFTKKPSIKQRQNETLDQFLERLAADYEDRPDFYSHGEPLFRSDDDLLRIEKELWVWADELRNARRRQCYPRNTGHCSDFGGCQFIPLCVGDADAPSLYQERPHHQVEKAEAA